MVFKVDKSGWSNCQFKEMSMSLSKAGSGYFLF